MSAEPRHAALAQRLILAHLTGDEDVYDITIDEIGECPGCWRGIAEYLAAEAAGFKQNDLGLHGAIQHAAREIAYALDTETDQ
jgi:hypothetical protein